MSVHASSVAHGLAEVTLEFEPEPGGAPEGVAGALQKRKDGRVAPAREARLGRRAAERIERKDRPPVRVRRLNDPAEDGIRACPR